MILPLGLLSLPKITKHVLNIQTLLSSVLIARRSSSSSWRLNRRHEWKHLSSWVSCPRPCCLKQKDVQAQTLMKHVCRTSYFCQALKRPWICGSFLEGVTSPLRRSHFSCGVSLGLAGPQQSSTGVVCQLPAASGRSYHLGYYFREALESSLQPPHHHGRHQKKKQKEHFREKTQKNQIAARDVSLPLQYYYYCYF